MKKQILFAVFIFAVLTASVIPANILNSESLSNNLEYNLEYIFNRYNTNVYESIYSINELRAYSIIQLDKTIEIYDNTWIAPETFSAMLDDKDKTILKEQIFKYFNSLDNIAKINMMNKIKYWCINDLQLNLLSSAYEFDINIIIASMHSIPLTNTILDLYNERGTIVYESISDKDVNQAYHNALNILINVNFNEQINYHSELLAILSEKIK